MTKIEKLCIEWLNDNYNHMEPFIMKEYSDYIFHMKNGKCILQHNTKNGYVYVSYNEIWKFFENMFGMSNQQIKDITKIWVEEHYKVGVTLTTVDSGLLNDKIEGQYKMGIITSGRSMSLPFYKVDERYKEITTTDNQLQFYLEKDVEELYLTNKQEIQ